MAEYHKPFACQEPGCGQSFASEDGLNAHTLNRHLESLLRMNSVSTALIADQTPTPTRFLKNCDELGLFQEIRNPFDEEFKKANEICLHETQRQVSCDSDGMSDGIVSAAIPFSVSQVSEDDDIGELVRQTDDTPLVIQPDSITVKEPAAIDASVGVSTAVSDLLAMNNTFSPVLSGTSQAVVGGQLVSVSLPQHLYIQVMGTQLDGAAGPQLIPLQCLMASQHLLPEATNVVSSSLPSAVLNMSPNSSNNVSQCHESPENGLKVLGIAAATREKLKAAVQTMHSRPTGPPQVVTSSSPSVEGGAPRIKIPRLGTPAATLAQTSAAYSPVQQAAADTSTPQHSGDKKNVEDDATRRQRFLESNRAAANRCRNRKKQWVGELETRVDGLEKENHRLEAESRTLKQEIIQLKRLLLEHRDCPAMANMLYFTVSQQQPSPSTGSS